MKIFVTTSWKNKYRRLVINALEKEGHTVYDFKTSSIFKWSENPIDLDTMNLVILKEEAMKAFDSNYFAISESDICVLILPAGKSSHMFAGMAVGMGKHLIIVAPEIEKNNIEMELGYASAYVFVSNLPSLMRIVKTFDDIIGTKE